MTFLEYNICIGLLYQLKASERNSSPTVLFQLTEETEMSVNRNRSNPLTITVIETEIHAKTVIKWKRK